MNLLKVFSKKSAIIILVILAFYVYYKWIYQSFNR